MNCRYCKEPVGDERNCEGCGARVERVLPNWKIGKELLIDGLDLGEPYNKMHRLNFAIQAKQNLGDKDLLMKSWRKATE